MCCARKSAPMRIGKTAEDDEFVWYNHTKYRGVTTRIESCVCTLLLLLLPVRCSLNVVSAELWMWWWREAMVNEECDANDVRAEWGSEHEPHDGLNVYKCLPLAAEFSLSWSFQAKTSCIDLCARDRCEENFYTERYRKWNRSHSSAYGMVITVLCTVLSVRCSLLCVRCTMYGDIIQYI